MKKTAIIYGELKSSVQKRAIEELSVILLDRTFEYPVCIQYGENVDTTSFRCVYIGTKSDNPYIKNNSKCTLSTDESYSISVKDDTAIIEGYDDAGVLYGVLDFYNKYLVKFEYPDIDEVWNNVWEKDTLPDFEITSSPSIKERGLWTWGHVIYDYRDYIRNTMKLKMNSVIIWNDFVPVNAQEIVEYAHSCNIKVYWGFNWLWDTKCDRFCIKDLDGESEKIFEKYQSEYANAGGDGIYFQTFTELHTDNIDGVIIAEAAAKFVNQTSTLFYEKYPDIELQFGLHATSVKSRLEFIRSVDPRIRIIWEDCGSFPFSYLPTDISDFDNTKALAKEIACLRGKDDRFGVVTKGLVKLDWNSFEHQQGQQYIGSSSKYMKKNRVDRKNRIWKYVQAGWMINSDKAQEMMCELEQIKGGNLSVFALVEDGMFEENIMYPIALFSEMLWECHADIKALIKDVALRDYVCFA